MNAFLTASLQRAALGTAISALVFCLGCGQGPTDRPDTAASPQGEEKPPQTASNATTSSNVTTGGLSQPDNAASPSKAPDKPAKRTAQPATGETNTTAAAGAAAVEAPADDPLDFAPGGQSGATDLTGDEPAEFTLPDERPKPMPTPPEAKGLKRFAEGFDVWLDVPNKRIVLGGKVARDRGQLEMFACLRQTKEHESVVSVNTKAQIVHALLVLLGADPGHPVEFRPKYRAATGPEIEVTVYWTDAEGKRQHARGQDWVRNAETGKALEQPWVFCGSGFWVSRDGKEKYYLAEDGDFICVSNFPSAMLDLPIKSENANDALLFEAFKDRVPPRDTPIVLVLHPKPQPAKQKTAAPKVEPIEAP